MYNEARASGVPLEPFSRIDPKFEKDLTPSTETIEAFNAYLRAAAVGSGPVEEMGRRHMSFYFSYRFKHRAAFFEQSPYATANGYVKGKPNDKECLRKTQTCLIERLSSLNVVTRAGVASGPLIPSVKLEDKLAMSPDFNPPEVAARYERFNRGRKLSSADSQAVAVAKAIDIKSVTPDIERFFAGYLHDSVAGFIGKNMDEYKFNNMGFVKFRTVFKGND